MKKGLSVREAENLARTTQDDMPKRRTSAGRATTKDADTLQIEAELAATLHMPVSIDHDSKGEGGKLSVKYGNLEQLDDLLRALSGT